MRHVCSVNGCKSSRYVSKKENREEERRYLFAARTTEVLELWRNAMPEGSILNKDDVICDLHFEEEDVLREYVTKMPDGTECRFKRGRVQLRKGAVPKFFQPPSYQEDKKGNLFPVIQPIQPFLDENALRESDFRNIFINSDKIPLPSLYWSVKALPNLILFNSWCQDSTLSSKRILLRPDKSVKIYMREKEVNLSDFQRVENVNDILDLLDRVEELDPCMSNSERTSVCTGYRIKTEKGIPGPRTKFCPACSKSIRSATRAEYRRSKRCSLEMKLREANKKLRGKLKTANRRQKRLVAKVQFLRAKVKNLQIKRNQIKKEAMDAVIGRQTKKCSGTKTIVTKTIDTKNIDTKNIDTKIIYCERIQL